MQQQQDVYALMMETLRDRNCRAASQDRDIRGIDIFKRFQRLRPPTFEGAPNPVQAEHWDFPKLVDKVMRVEKDFDCTIKSCPLVRDAPENQLYAKLTNCKFWEEEVKFLGHVVKVEGIAIDPAKVEAITKWELPTTVTKVRSFLAMAGYYKRFIKEFSRIARPLTQLIRKNNWFTWDENTKAAFQELKMRLTSAPVLTLPQEGVTFVVYSDASKLGLGCVLM
ncbi:uncharacterized mitochondrial protein AtMg00860-like [Magnolia sinica]|uniref:uncharacterized mitochondrial protein AtMg00860-like n=1 Tax=Magnolia sinica TaxID=86752 RepID=UPI0026588FFF|nr:uncharacterized mitochondrial protein AtMg00860-like [Magnolia sinica]